MTLVDITQPLIIAGIGSRKTPLAILDEMREIGARVKAANGWVRSGGAEGADRAFEEGSKDRTVVYLPWKPHDEARFFHEATGSRVMVWDDANEEAKLRARSCTEKTHPATHALSTYGWLLHSRNYFQIMGVDERPVRAVVCYAPVVSGNPQGGTAQAIRVAVLRDIPVYNMFFDKWATADAVCARLGI